MIGSYVKIYSSVFLSRSLFARGTVMHRGDREYDNGSHFIQDRERRTRACRPSGRFTNDDGIVVDFTPFAP
jgi:hypothetical protein